MLNISAGVLIGFGLSGCSFNIVHRGFGKLVPENWRSIAFGAGTAAGSFGQFLFSPIGVALIDAFGWQTTLLIFACLLLLIVPLSLALATAARPTARRPARRAPTQSMQALSEAFGHRSYVLLVLGFFTCGFQLAFVTVHLPAYLIDRGLERRSAAGRSPPSACSTSSARSARVARQPHAEALLSLRRSISAARWRWSPSSRCRPRPRHDRCSAPVTGLLWLSTVPPTSAWSR